MFWDEEKKFSDARDEEIDAYISSNNLTDLLNLPYTLQELCGGNRKLLDYFSRDDVLVALTTIALRPEVNESVPIKDRYKFSNACSEILALRNNNEIMNSFLNCEGALNILREFFHDNPSKNHLVCGFYAKIVQRSFHVSPEKTFEALSSCDFISDCAANLRMGAISDLLQNIVWIQGVDDDFLKIKQWYVSHGLCSKLVDLLDPNQAACVHENVMELYCNLVRNTRSQMYALEMKSDILNDELQSEILVGKLLDKMLMRHKNGTVFSSVTRNVCEILISLLSSNNILYRPSHTLYKDYNAEFSWVGGNPSSVSNGNISDVSNETDATVWCSDSERVVEKMVASRVSEFLDLVVEELESDTNPTDENWSYLLRVLIELCDTNHMETHILLEGQFKKCATGKLFSMVWRHPRSSILHSLLQRIIFFILYSSMESLSPLITYLFKTLDVPTLVRYGIQPSCALPKLDLQSLRTYHIHLALAIEQARKSSPNSQGIEELVQEFPFWSEIMTNIEEWVSSNLPDPAVVNLRPSNQRACVDDVMDDFERQALAPHHTALLEFKNESVSSSMTDVFDTPLGELQTSSETKGFYVHGIRVCNVEVNLEENDVDESKFEAVCAMKECPILNDWPMQHGDQSYDCHAVAKERQHEDATTFQVQCNQQPSKANNAGFNDWPCFPQGTSTPKKNDSDDEWADFSSLRTSLTSDDCTDWPGVEGKESSTSLITNETEIDNPVLTGLATAVTNSLLDECATHESEC